MQPVLTVTEPYTLSNSIAMKASFDAYLRFILFAQSFISFLHVVILVMEASTFSRFSARYLTFSRKLFNWSNALAACFEAGPERAKSKRLTEIISGTFTGADQMLLRPAFRQALHLKQAHISQPIASESVHGDIAFPQILCQLLDVLKETLDW